MSVVLSVERERRTENVFHMLLRIFIPFGQGGNRKGAPLNAFVIVQERNSSSASKLERERERDSRRKSFIYSSNLKN